MNNTPIIINEITLEDLYYRFTKDILLLENFEEVFINLEHLLNFEVKIFDNYIDSKLIVLEIPEKSPNNLFNAIAIKPFEFLYVLKFLHNNEFIWNKFKNKKIKTRFTHQQITNIQYLKNLLAIKILKFSINSNNNYNEYSFFINKSLNINYKKFLNITSDMTFKQIAKTHIHNYTSLKKTINTRKNKLMYLIKYQHTENSHLVIEKPLKDLTEKDIKIERKKGNLTCTIIFIDPEDEDNIISESKVIKDKDIFDKDLHTIYIYLFENWSFLDAEL